VSLLILGVGETTRITRPPFPHTRTCFELMCRPDAYAYAMPRAAMKFVHLLHALYTRVIMPPFTSTMNILCKPHICVLPREERGYQR